MIVLEKWSASLMLLINGGLEDILLNLDAEKAFDRFNRPFKFSVLYNFLALKGTCQF